MSATTPPLELGAAELASVESFRRLKETAVLTIMFTDIVGFTQLTDEKGEQHSNEIRRLHDEVLESEITRGGAGVVVKHIGDAIMAVFSEPSTAVERALGIHKGLERLARERPDLDPIKVKIGLDMGQVTVEERVDADVFGRHVNRASRVEGTANGGQVLMTYTVFDSARAWLSTPGNAELQWASHGRYRLKGVATPVEIFEVVDPEHGALKPPEGGERVRSTPPAAWAAGLVLLGIVGTLAWGNFQTTEVWLAEYAPPLSYLDGEELRLEGEEGDNERRVLLDVGPGRHVLHYDVADAVRYYAELDLERGENHVRVDFEESRLPTTYRYRALGDEPIEGTRQESYFFYDRDGERVEHTTALFIRVAVEPSTEVGSMNALFSWRVDIDGVAVAEGSRNETRSVAAMDQLRDEFEVWSDEHHRYSVRLRVARATAHLDLLAAFRARVPESEM
ncbi:MAG: adenylate/guanylate cyclase domain-containing protein [Gemmatimonadetes bacterium]|nr:adenylate/guanylate cyclase domain-containing protein [Gemmatimonadota bacterium]